MIRVRSSLLLVSTLAALSCQSQEPPQSAASAPVAEAPSDGTSASKPSTGAADAAPRPTAQRPVAAAPQVAAEQASAPVHYVPDAQAADVIYTRGAILPMTAPGEVAEAIAIGRGKVLLVGSQQAVMSAHRGKRTSVVDLAGKAVVPGFIAGRGNLAWTALSAKMLSVAPLSAPNVQNIQGVLDELRKAPATGPFGEWIVATGYDPSLVAEKRHLTRDDLDQISFDRPMVVIDERSQVASCSSACLRAMGWDRKSKDPLGGGLRRLKQTKEPTGILEDGAYAKLLEKMPQISEEDALAALESTQARYLARGVTTVHDRVERTQELALLQRAARGNALHVDVVVTPAYSLLDQVLAEFPNVPTDYYAARLRRGGVLLSFDGSAQYRAAWLSQPYATLPEGALAGFRGKGRIDNAELSKVLERAKRESLQVFGQCNGDQACEQFLKASERVLAGDKADRRWVMLNAQTIREDQLDRMKLLSLVPSFSSSQLYYWSDAAREAALGPERSENLEPAQWAVERGLRFSIHDESPSVPTDPFVLLWAATNRVTRDDNLLGGDQRITTYNALKALTADAAYQSFEEKDKGTLEPGKRADLVILGQNPLTEPLSSLKSIDVVETIKDGQSVWAAR